MINTLEAILDLRASNYKPQWRKKGLHYTIFSKSTSPIRQKIRQRPMKTGLENCLISDTYDDMINHVAYYSRSPSILFTFQSMAMFMKRILCYVPPFSEAPNRVHIGKEVVASELMRLSYNLKNDSCKTYKRSLIDRRLLYFDQNFVVKLKI